MVWTTSVTVSSLVGLAGTLHVRGGGCFLCVFAGSVYVARLLGFSYSEAVTAWHDTPWFQYHTWP